MTKSAGNFGTSQLFQFSKKTYQIFQFLLGASSLCNGFPNFITSSSKKCEVIIELRTQLCCRVQWLWVFAQQIFHKFNFHKYFNSCKIKACQKTLFRAIFYYLLFRKIFKVKWARQLHIPHKKKKHCFKFLHKNHKYLIASIFSLSVLVLYLTYPSHGLRKFIF